MAAPRKLPRRFGANAKMEAANALLVPGLALWFGWPRNPWDALALALAILACAGLLVVGAFYWHGLDRRLTGKGKGRHDQALRFADRAERPALLATIAATVATVIAAALNGLTGSLIAAAVLSLLAALEYVNYYHRQMQHFDNRSDFVRLLTGRGARPSHMARDLAAFRARTR